MCLLHRPAEDIWSCKLYQINDYRKQHMYLIEQKKTEEQIVHGSEC